jgi:protein phosphatase
MTPTSDTPPATNAPRQARRKARLAADRLPLVVHSYGMTHPGRVRSANEDQFLVAELVKALRVRRSSLPQEKFRFGAHRAYLLAVADGVSGSPGGEEASALAIDSVERFVVNALSWVSRPESADGIRLLAEFRTALRRTDARICRRAKRHPSLAGMASTLTLAYSLGRDLFVAHVGDSRCYLFRGKTLYRLTSDHTAAEEMVRKGRLPPQAVDRHEFAHQIINFVGGPEDGIRPELHKLHLEPGDVLLVCSDGLTSMVPDADIAQVLRREPNPRRACERLVARANAKGGQDNVTVVLARYDAPVRAKK